MRRINSIILLIFSFIIFQFNFDGKDYDGECLRTISNKHGVVIFVDGVVKVTDQNKNYEIFRFDHFTLNRTLNYITIEGKK